MGVLSKAASNKPPPSKSKSVAKAILAADPKLAKATAKKKASKSDHWALKVRASTCQQCQQDTHQIDKDDPEGGYLHWTKTQIMNGLKTPMGCVCTACIYVRSA